jgi:hypothetical protein
MRVAHGNAMVARERRCQYIFAREKKKGFTINIYATHNCFSLFFMYPPIGMRVH